MKRSLGLSAQSVRPARLTTQLLQAKRSYAGAAEARATERRLGLPPFVLNQTPTQVSTLPNQLRVASEYRYGETATVGVFIDAGSAFEDARTNGVAHFLEHMAFKGTKNRTQQQIEL